MGDLVGEELDREVRALLRAAGVGVPEARFAAMRDAYLGHRAHARVLAEPLPRAAEPAGLFAVPPDGKGGR